MQNKYEVRGDVTAIYIEKDGVQYEALIDTEDMIWSGEFGKLRLSKGKSDYYLACGRIRELYHRFITKAPKGLVVDHINHNTLDNRKCNLRVVTQGVNNLNSRLRKNNKSGVTGVYWVKNKQRWRVRLIIQNKSCSFGLYKDLEEAAKVAYEARKPYLPEVVS